MNSSKLELPWCMSPAAWEVFKRNPAEWQKQIRAGRLVLEQDGSLSSPGECTLDAWVRTPVYDREFVCRWRPSAKPSVSDTAAELADLAARPV